MRTRAARFVVTVMPFRSVSRFTGRWVLLSAGLLGGLGQPAAAQSTAPPSSNKVAPPAPAPAPAPTPEDVLLLREIRDSLRK